MHDDSQRWDAIHQKIHPEKTRHTQYAEDKEKLFPRNSVVVDLGGGTGEDALYFLQSGHSVILFDISEFAIKKAQEKAAQYNLSAKLVVRQVDYGLEPIPLKNESVDVAFSRISLDYFPMDQTIMLFHEIFRVLKPQGKAYLAFKSPEDEKEMEVLRKFATVYEPGVYIHNNMLLSRFSKDQLAEILTKAGVPKFEVNKYVEEQHDQSEETHPDLILNDISFTKE